MEAPGCFLRCPCPTCPQHGLSMETTHETVKDKEYGKHLPKGKLLRLEDPPFPSSPYGAAKVRLASRPPRVPPSFSPRPSVLILNPAGCCVAAGLPAFAPSCFSAC